MKMMIAMMDGLLWDPFPAGWCIDERNDRHWNSSFDSCDIIQLQSMIFLLMPSIVSRDFLIHLLLQAL